MSIRVKLAEIIDGMESQSDEAGSFLNKKTGEVVLITDYEMRTAEDEEPIEDIPEWEQDQVRIAREIIAGTGDYIELPTRSDINEYGIMESFCQSIQDTELRDTFCDLIQGSGAFRRFKDALYRHGIEDDWDSYRNEAYTEIAIEWCRNNDIEFEE